MGTTLQFYASKISPNGVKTRGVAWNPNDKIGVLAFVSGQPIATATPAQTNLKYETTRGNGLFTPTDASNAVTLDKSKGIDIIAYYPWQTNLGNDGIISIDLANSTSGNDPDILVSRSAKDIKCESQTPTLQFEHVLARVTVRAENATASTTLALEGLIAEGSYSLRTGEVKLGTQRNAIPMRHLGNGLYEAIVLPGQSVKGAKINVKHGGQTLTSTIERNETVAAGKEYAFTCTLSGTAPTTSTATAYKEIPSPTRAQPNIITVTHRAPNRWFNSNTAGDRRNYSLCYSTAHNQPLWVAYPLYADCFGDTKRTDGWGYDPKIPEKDQIDLGKGSYGLPNISRGHMLMSGQRTATRELNKTTFYFTNMVPQNTDQNGSQWQQLENKQIAWAKNKSYDTLFTVCGPIFEGNIETFKKDNKTVSIPSHTYKVMLRQHKQSQTWHTLAVKMPNASNAPKWQDCIVPIAQLERELGMDFFPNFPNAEDAGSRSNLSHWS